MAFTIVCAQHKPHIHPNIKRMESATRRKVTRVAKVFDQIAREDISFIKKRIPKVSFYKEEMDVDTDTDTNTNVDTDTKVEVVYDNDDIYDDLL